MKTAFAVLSILFSSLTFSAVTLECDLAYGEGVYTSFNLKFEAMNDNYGLPYSLKELVGTQVTLEGVVNQNHEDNDDIGEEWTFATPGPRTSTIKNDTWDNDGVYFNIETCKDCDFNGATYQYRRSNEGDIFMTEMYGSDGSGEFSLYSCK